MTDQSETPNQNPKGESPSESATSGSNGTDKSRIPRLALAVGAAGIVLSLAIYGLSFVPGNGSQAIEWDTIQPIEAPAAQKVGGGSFAVARTSLSALAPNDDGLLLYRVGGVVRVDSAGRKPTVVRCDIYSKVSGDTRIARSTKLRAAWPKPSDKLQAQDVPDASTVKFSLDGSKKVDLPIHDVIQRYTDSLAKTLVAWPGYVEDEQTWIWTMDNGTGPGAATLPWVVIFESETRPKGSIECKAQIGGKSAKVSKAFVQKQWPIADVNPNSGDAGTGDVSNVQ